MILKKGQTVTGVETGTVLTIGELLGEGGQGEVYKAQVRGGGSFAVKWYYPGTDDVYLQQSLATAIKMGAPNESFLWPIELLCCPSTGSYGYYMPLRSPNFKDLTDLMRRKVNISFRILATIGANLSMAFLDLHAKGMCYRDISFGNAFFDPSSGDILVCDNDNATIDGDPNCQIEGTPNFIAPEIVRREARPSADTDRYSLAVLLFYLCFMHHPLYGKREYNIKSLDFPAISKLCGTDPLFIYDPNDDSNRPVPSYHTNVIAFWEVYPQFIKDIFVKAFTNGLRDPIHGRIRETEWRDAFLRLRDSIMYCRCGKQNFWEIQNDGRLHSNCWACKTPLVMPLRIRINKRIIILNHDSYLYNYQTSNNVEKTYDFTKPIAAVSLHPKNPNIWGLQNRSKEKWVCTKRDGKLIEVIPGKTVQLENGLRINFGGIEGEIKL